MSESTNVEHMMSVFRSEHDRVNPPTPEADGGATGGQPPHKNLLRIGRIAWAIGSWIGVLAVAAAVLAVAALILVPRALGWQGMVVLSGSMEPTLQTGGLAFMEKLSPDQVNQVQVGDIITFENPRANTLVSHRVVEIVQEPDGLAFVTKGDANADADGTPVKAGRVVGEVKYDIPQLGNVVLKLQNRTTYFIFLGIPAALLILSEAWNIVTEVRRNRRGENRASEQGAAS